MAGVLRTAVRYLRDQVRRRAGGLSRRVRILTGYGEYSRRRETARAVDPASCYDVPTLWERGYVPLVLSDETLAPLVRACREKVQREGEGAPSMRYKTFFRQLLSEEDLKAGSVFLLPALDEKILRTAACYLGVAPFLEQVELFHSLPEPLPLKLSQLWHRDRTDRAVLKVFIYVEDVGERNGPFTLIPARDSDRVPEYLSHYVTDEVMGRYVARDKVVEIKGPSGTAFLVDSTTCYHQGSRCQAPRLAYVAYYNTGFSYQARERRWDAAVLNGADASPLRRFALGLPADSR